MIELGMFLDDNLENQNSLEEKSIDQKSQNDNISGEVIETDKEKEATEEENTDHGSIESVSFISQPAKKKSVKTKKDSA